MLTIGNILDGRYHIRERVGDGGFGAVYLAEDVRFSGKNLVAVKEIRPRSEAEAKALKHEADLLYNLTHPNLPKVSNCFQESGAYFIVMDFVSGEDLSQMLKRGKRFDLDEVLRIADVVLDALEYLHSFPVFHRDIKPHNIKIDETGKIFLLDFGTAKGNLEDDTHTKAGQSITGFTPFYAPLEQVLRVDTNSYLILQSEHETHLQRFLEYRTDERSDIYGLGATLYHLLSGNSPQNSISTFRARAIWANQADPLPPLSTVNSSIPQHISQTLQKALAIEPNQRFRTAREFRNALKQNSTADKTLSFADFTQTSLPNIAANNQTEILPRTISASASEVLAKEEVQPIGEMIPKTEKTPNSKKKTAILGAMFAVFLFVIAGLGIWLAKDKLFKKDTVKVEETPQPTNTNPLTNSETPKVKTSVPRSVDYSLLVQKMRDGKEYQTPFESSGQEIFENGYRFQMRLTPSENGFLYLFNEGLNDKGEKIFQILFPTPKRNNGSAEVKASQKIDTAWNEFGGKAGTENFWIIWSNAKSEIVEKARENAFSSDIGAITDKVSEQNLRTFLEEKKKSEVKNTKDVEKKLSKLQFEGDSAAYLMQLEHR
jgi:serine/threonine protein kinase